MCRRLLTLGEGGVEVCFYNPTLTLLLGFCLFVFLFVVTSTQCFGTDLIKGFDRLSWCIDERLKKTSLWY